MKKILVLILVAALAAPAFAVFGTSHSTDLGCNACHTPHNANISTTAPLWGATTMNTVGFTIYGGGTTITGSTVLCMTCHDGTDATTTSNTSVGSKTLTNMHPISKELEVAAGSYRAPTGLVELELDSVSSENRVECGSCHDVHNSAIASPALVEGTTTLCNNCHLK